MWKSSRIRCGCALALKAIADRCLSCVVGMTTFSYAGKCWLVVAPHMYPCSPAKRFLRRVWCIVRGSAAEHHHCNAQVATLQEKAAAAEAIVNNADIAVAAVAVAKDTVREVMKANTKNFGIAMMLSNPALMRRWQRCRQRPRLHWRQR